MLHKVTKQLYLSFNHIYSKTQKESIDIQILKPIIDKLNYMR